jgi:formamidopyrimidine-DNA glycosylase
MPELPEVETLRRDLARRLAGAHLGALWTSGKPLRLGRPLDVERIAAMTVGHRVARLRRLAKYILIDTSGGGSLVVHLGMSGHLLVCRVDEPRAPHTHLVWALDRGRELRYVDPRRFGHVTAIRRGEESELPELQVLGVEPLGRALTTARLTELMAATARPLKAFLLDQSRVAGLGNIYVSEALFRARLHPSLPSREALHGAAVLRQAIRDVLGQAVRNGGTTIRNYTDSSGREGRNQLTLQVYGRDGQPCYRCGTPISRQVDSGRSTFFCSKCQPAGPTGRSFGRDARSKKPRAKGRSGIR